MATAVELGREIILRARSLRDALALLSSLSEKEVPGASAGYTLVDPTGRLITESIFPSLPSFFQDSISNVPLVEPAIGTCVKSLLTGTTITSNDILADAQFDPNWRDLCLRSGLKSVQSKPIRSRDGPAQGTFVLGFREPADNRRWDETLMADFANLAAEAIQLYRTLQVEPVGAHV